MLITSHLLGTLAVGEMLSLDKPEMYTALAAGIGVDIDHLFVNNKWVSDIRNFMKYQKITYGVNQHSWIQEIVFGTITGILLGLILSYLSQSIRWWIFPIFLVIHILMDSLMRNEHRPLIPFSKFSYVGWIRSGTKQEIMISCLGLGLLWFLA